MNVSGSGLCEAEGDDQQREVDQRVDERNALEALKVITSRPSIAAIARSGSSASAGQPLELGRPPRERVVLGVGDDLGARRRARPGRAASRALGQADERLDGDPLGASPTTPPAARARACAAGFSPRVDGAAGAERPAARPGREPGGAPAGEPATVAVRARRTSPRCSAPRRSRLSRSAQRIGSSSSTSRLGARLEGRPGAPRAVVRRRAALAQRADRGVGRLARRRRRLVGVSRQRTSTCSSAHGPRARSPGRQRHRVQARWRWRGRGRERSAASPGADERRSRVSSVHHGLGLGGGGGRGRGRGRRVGAPGEEPAGAAGPRSRARRRGGSCGCSRPTGRGSRASSR